MRHPAARRSVTPTEPGGTSIGCHNEGVRTLLFILATGLFMAGCSGQAAVTQTPSTIASASALNTPAAQPATPSGLATPSVASTPSLRTLRTVRIELTNGKVSPNGARVELNRGEPFMLDITSDRDDEIHVHGFDKTIGVKAGDRVKVPMIADRTGRFEVESHHPALLIVVLQIR